MLILDESQEGLDMLNSFYPGLLSRSLVPKFYPETCDLVFLLRLGCLSLWNTECNFLSFTADSLLWSWYDTWLPLQMAVWPLFDKSKLWMKQLCSPVDSLAFRVVFQIVLKQSFLLFQSSCCSVHMCMVYTGISEGAALVPPGYFLQCVPVTNISLSLG